MSAEEADPPAEDIDDDSGMTMTRRRAMRATAAAGGTLAAGGSLIQLGGVENASAIDVDCESAATGLGVATGGLVGGAVGYAAGQKYCPDDVDRSAEQEEADWENWVDIYSRARKGQLYDENQLGAARRDAGGMRHQGIVDAMVAAANEAETGSDKETGMQAAKDAANTMMDRTLEGFWNHWEIRIGEYAGDAWFLQTEDFSTNVDVVMDAYDEQTDEWQPTSFDAGNPDYGPVTVLPPDSDGFSTVDATLPSGSTITITSRMESDQDVQIACLNPDETFYPLGSIDNHPYTTEGSFQGYNDSVWLTNPRVREPDASIYDAVDPEEYDTEDFDGPKVYLDVIKFWETLEELREVQTNTINQVETLVDQHWDALVAGEIDPTQITSMGGVLDAMNNADSFREIVTGFKSSGHWVADTATVVELNDPEGEETIEVDGQFSWNRANEPDPFPVGAEIDPSSTPGDLYFAYNVEDDSGEVVGANYTLLEEPFTITATESGASEVTWTRNAIDDTDVTTEEIRTILEDIEQSRRDAEQARQDINVDTGGFTLFPDGGLGLGGAGGAVASAIGTIVVVIALLFGYNVVSDDS